MRVISVIGITGSGKTTTIEKIIKELKTRNYTVGTVKEIHFEDFHIDAEGSNTDRHKKAGSELVTARGHYETDILFQQKLSIEKILTFYDHDFVILEGVMDSFVPKIITAYDAEGIEEKMDKTIFAVSGRIAGEISEYKGFPAINSLSHIQELVDLIEEKTKNQDSVIENTNVTLKVGGKEIAMIPSIYSILKNTVENVVRELDGDIEICIKR